MKHVYNWLVPFRRTHMKYGITSTSYIGYTTYYIFFIPIVRIQQTTPW